MAASPRAVTAAFEQVLPLDDRPVGVHPAGGRALVSAGPTFVGYAEAGKRFVADAMLGAGLPKTSERADEPALLGGRWPELLLVHGHWGGSGGDPAYALYTTHGKGWSRVGRRTYDRPEAIVRSGAGFAFYEPDPFHLINGLLPMSSVGTPQYPCNDSRSGASAPGLADAHTPEGDSPSQTLAAGLAGGASIRAAASFFAVAVGSDGAGKPFGWGFVACKPGAFAFEVKGGRVVPEPVPGTATCDDRDEGTGLPLVSVRLFPDAGGGVFALVGPGHKPAPSCPSAWRRLERGPTGWRDLGALPQRDAQTKLATVDPAGTAYLATERGTVLRIDLAGTETELGLAPSCLATPPVAEGDNPPDDPAISAIFAPFPCDVWVTVTRGPTAATLCRHISSP